ncbi:MAG TPA: PLP-dependent aminotransferase family protein [Thermoplasmatales archaeon]|nr:PLP-dependent aminotransferase family protein [Thermoplasmatales archaeon]HEX08578.1 PLP-dependent aminotransferase family protein [Thermoplasmatales archaeon]
MRDLSRLFSDRAKKFRKSEIRELLKVTESPDIISFAGGLPNPATFPIKELQDISNYILKNHGKEALQYGTTEGYRELRKILAERAYKDGINVTEENVLITGGSQQALDIIGKIFLEPGDTAIVGLPSYLGGLNAFRSYECNMVGIPLDKDGMIIDVLEEKIKELIKEKIIPKFIYVIPTFQNPAGVVLSEKRRKKLLDIANEHDLLIIEDDPYSRLRYSGNPIKPLKSFDDEDRVIYMSTFSKILSPGFRLAWVIGDAEIIKKMVIAKQAMDLCTNTFTQHLAYEFIRRGSLDLHILKIIEIYKPKRDIMIKSIEEYFPEGYTCNRPEGGMFAWVTLPEYIDTEKMFIEAIKEKVAYVHGRAFYVDGSGGNTMRLNFSYPSNEQIEEGIKRLAKVIEKEMKKNEK